MGGIKGLSLYEKKDNSIKSVSPEVSIEKRVHNSWIQLTNSLFESGAQLEHYKAVVDRRATKDGEGGYHLFCTVEDEKGKQIDVQISEFTRDQERLLARIFDWEVAAPAPSSSSSATSSMAAAPADFSEIKDLLKTQAENLEHLSGVVYGLQKESTHHFNLLENVLAAQDQAHIERMEQMKRDYDEQLLELLQQMKDLHNDFVNSVNITLSKPDEDNKDEEIRKLRYCINVLEGISKHIVPEVSAVHEAMLEMRGQNRNGGINPEIIKEIVVEQKRLFDEHRALLTQMDLLRQTLEGDRAANRELTEKTDLMTQKNMEVLRSLKTEIEEVAKNNVAELQRIVDAFTDSQKREGDDRTTLVKQLNGLLKLVDQMRSDNRGAIGLLTERLDQTNLTVEQREAAQEKMGTVLEQIVTDQRTLAEAFVDLRALLQNRQDHLEETVDRNQKEQSTESRQFIESLIERLERRFQEKIENFTNTFVRTTTNTFRKVVTEIEPNGEVVAALQRCEALLEQMLALLAQGRGSVVTTLAPPVVVERTEPREVEEVKEDMLLPGPSPILVGNIPVAVTAEELAKDIVFLRRERLTWDNSINPNSTKVPIVNPDTDKKKKIFKQAYGLERLGKTEQSKAYEQFVACFNLALKSDLEKNELKKQKLLAEAISKKEKAIAYRDEKLSKLEKK